MDIISDVEKNPTLATELSLWETSIVDSGLRPVAWLWVSRAAARAGSRRARLCTDVEHIPTVLLVMAISAEESACHLTRAVASATDLSLPLTRLCLLVLTLPSYSISQRRQSGHMEHVTPRHVKLR